MYFNPKSKFFHHYDSKEGTTASACICFSSCILIKDIKDALIILKIWYMYDFNFSSASCMYICNMHSRF